MRLPCCKEALRRRLIGALSDALSHAVEGHHLGGDIGRALKIVGRAGRNVAFEEENFGGTPAHEHGDTIPQFACRQKKAVFRRVLDRIWEIDSFIV
jgi:hypothetical protein